ncbi:substrate-binding periplasmic protein [Curvivirga sp.]|uniref:substrate-binding periplasmic protein n=1 Tax=Curvivirga sp. TaxID=2856848 RepID=UPI003B5C9AA0
MKKIFTQIQITLFALFLTSSAYANDVLRLGANVWMPYVMQDANGIHGIAVDKAFKIFSEIDKDLKISLLPFKRVLQHAKNGTTHGVLLSANRSDRQEYLAFTLPVFCERRIFITTDKRKFDWQDSNQLRSKRLGMGLGYYVGKRINEWVETGLIPPITKAKDESLFELLKNDRLDFIIYSEKEFIEFQKLGSQHVDGLSVLEEPLNELTLHIGFSIQHDGVAYRDKANSIIQRLNLQEDCSG